MRRGIRDGVSKGGVEEEEERVMYLKVKMQNQ